VDDAGNVALNVVFMGPPGAGKGTQAERFAQEHGIPKISTGDILRDAVAAKTPLGLEVKSLMDRGDLVSDDLIIGIVTERLARPDVSRGFVLDGFPRTVPQAVALDALLVSRGPLIVIEIQVPDEELVRRVVSRRICSKCGRNVSAFGADGKIASRCMYCQGELISRADDSEKVVRDRLKVYWRETQPMIAFHQARPTYRAIDGAQAPERVRDALVAAVASALGKPGSELKAGTTRRSEKNA
jgi:adenylate kinase